MIEIAEMMIRGINEYLNGFLNFYSNDGCRMVVNAMVGLYVIRFTIETIYQELECGYDEIK